MHVTSSLSQAAYIYAQMIRIRTAILMALFAVIGGLMASGRADLDVKIFVAIVAVTHLYILATCLNDVADQKIDEVNLKDKSSERPLIKGNGTKNQLLAVGIVSGIVALTLSCALGFTCFVLMLVAVAYVIIYSLPPVQLSYRGIIAPLTLPFIYVALPFLLSYWSFGYPLNRVSELILVGLYLCFIGRIVLKDIRDIKGDSRFGKKTFVIRYGLPATCWMGIAAVSLGFMFLLIYNWLNLAFLISILVVWSGLIWLYIRLSSEKEKTNRLIYVAAIGRLGNSIVISIILLIMLHNGASKLISLFIIANTIIHIMMAYESLLYINQPVAFEERRSLLDLIKVKK